MQIDGFLELVKKRRSIRRLKPDPFPEEYIDKILEAARWAMSGANGQPWEFIVVRNRDTIKKMADHYLETLSEMWYIEQTRIEELRQPIFGGKTPPEKRPGWEDAPVIIVVCGDPRTFQATVLSSIFLPGEGGPRGNYYKNVGNATQNIHLAAAALGLGAQWVSVISTLDARLKSLLEVPEELTIHTIVPLGYPAYEPPPPYRRELKEITHFEKYERSKHRSGKDIFNWFLELRQRSKAPYAFLWKKAEK